MPRSATEPVTNEKDADEDRDGERNHGSDSAHREDGANGDFAAKDEKQNAAPDGGVEPHGVDGRLGLLVNALDPRGERKAVIARVRKRHTGGSNHAPLSHEKPADDGDG